MKRLLLNILLLVCGYSYGQTSTIGDFYGNDCDHYSQLLIKDINKAREERGLSILEIDDLVLNNFTLPHTQYMLSLNRWTHNEDHYDFKSRLKIKYRGKVGTFISMGENVHCLGKWQINLAKNQIFVDYMNSPGHRANILNPKWTHIAVSTLYNPDQHKYYNTINFIQK